MSLLGPARSCCSTGRVLARTAPPQTSEARPDRLGPDQRPQRPHRPQKFALDVWYVDHQSFWLDLKIIALTDGRFLRQDGISHANHATMEEFRG